MLWQGRKLALESQGSQCRIANVAQSLPLIGRLDLGEFAAWVVCLESGLSYSDRPGFVDTEETANDPDCSAAPVVRDKAREDAWVNRVRVRLCVHPRQLRVTQP